MLISAFTKGSHFFHFFFLYFQHSCQHIFHHINLKKKDLKVQFYFKNTYYERIKFVVLNLKHFTLHITSDLPVACVYIKSIFVFSIYFSASVDTYFNLRSKFYLKFIKVLWSFQKIFICDWSWTNIFELKYTAIWIEIQERNIP